MFVAVSITACCRAIGTTEKENVTVRERAVIVQGFETSASIGSLSQLQAGQSLYVVGRSMRDTVVRIRTVNNTVFADVECPDDTVFVTDTLRVKETLTVQEKQSFWEVVGISGTALFAWILLAVIAIMYFNRARKYNA
jgi:hypothetical protein